MPLKSIKDHDWQLISPQSLLMEEFGDNTLCYNKHSAETHLLNAFPAELLKLIITKPGTTEELAKKLAESLGTDYDEKWLQSVARVLKDLQQIHLIETCEP